MYFQVIFNIKETGRKTWMSKVLKNFPISFWNTKAMSAASQLSY